MPPALPDPRDSVFPGRFTAKDAEVQFFTIIVMITMIMFIIIFVRHLVVPLTLPDDSDDGLNR